MSRYQIYQPRLSWRSLAKASGPRQIAIIVKKRVLSDEARWPVVLLSWFCRLFNLRFIRFQIDYFGHQLMEPDLFLKERALGRLPKRRYLWLIDQQLKAVSNRFLLEAWKERIPHLHLTFLDLRYGFFKNAYACPEIFHNIEPYITAINATGLFGIIQHEWGNRPPVIGISPSVEKRGRAALRQLGVPDGAWFACLHCRESGFHRYRPDQFFRNADLATYLAAAAFVVEQGGWVIRVGDPSMTRLPARPGLIDYAHSALKSDWLYVYLGAACRYFVGSGSGPASIAPVFGKPMCMANNLPLSASLFYCHDTLGLATPKLLRSKREQRLLTFAEQLGSEIGNFRFTELYREAGLEWIDNDEDDILSMAKELHAMAEGSFSLSVEDRERQNRFRALFRPGHYGYQCDCLLSPAFLKRHEALL
jgi:putative glycosyltransferase (TIGR04372 family)